MKLDKTLQEVPCGYNQSGQALDIKFAFVNKVGDKELRSRYPLVICRDYLADDIYAAHFPERRFKIYGFEPPAHPIDLDATRLLIKTPYKWNLKLLEDIHKFYEQPDFYLEELEPDLWYLESSNYWIKNTVMFSWYAFMLKRCLEPGNEHTLDTMFSGVQKWENGPFMHIDYFYMLQAMKELPHMGVSNIPSRYGADASLIHNYSGFASCINYPKYTVHGETLNKILKTLAKNKDKKQCDAELATQI